MLLLKIVPVYNLLNLQGKVKETIKHAIKRYAIKHDPKSQPAQLAIHGS